MSLTIARTAVIRKMFRDSDQPVPWRTLFVNVAPAASGTVTVGLVWNEPVGVHRDPVAPCQTEDVGPILAIMPAPRTHSLPLSVVAKKRSGRDAHVGMVGEVHWYVNPDGVVASWNDVELPLHV